MSQNPSNPGQPPAGGKPNDSGTFSQSFEHNPVAARVPDRVAKGVMSTGAIVLDSPNEFVIDFLQGLTRPFHVAARIVVPPSMMHQLIVALGDNINKYTNNFGPPPQLPKPPQQHRPTIQEIYETFKVSDDMLSGVYANTVMIGHSPAEFFFDFITGFYPTAAVSSRVYVAAPQAPRLLDTFTMAMQTYQKRYLQPRQDPNQNPPPQNPQG